MWTLLKLHFEVYFYSALSALNVELKARLDVDRMQQQHTQNVQPIHQTLARVSWPGSSNSVLENGSRGRSVSFDSAKTRRRTPNNHYLKPGGLGLETWTVITTLPR